jgi:predicted dehydrogenase
MSDMVRWGILGTGKIARIVAEAIAASRDGRLVAVGSRDGARAGAFAEEFDVEHVHAGYEGVLHDDDVDLVYVATHHPHHRRWAVAAAEAGKHVLCEKPIAVRSADAVDIVEAARAADVFLLEAFAYRSHPQTHRLRQLLRDGAIGEVRVIDAAFGYDAGPAPTNYLMVHELAGGSILDVGCYTTSMAHLVAAAASGADAVETEDVVAAATIGPTGVDHSTAATLTFPGGAIARVACSIQANLDSRLQVVGSKGRITVPSPWLPGRIGSTAEIVVERWGADVETIDVPLAADVYTVEVDAVDEMVTAGERSPSVMTWEDSLANMRTLDRWRASIGLRFGDEGVA